MPDLPADCLVCDLDAALDAARERSRGSKDLLTVTEVRRLGTSLVAGYLIVTDERP